MPNSRRPATVALIVAAALIVAYCLIWGLHYRGLDGGQPRRTAGNENSAIVALWTAGVVSLLAGLGAILIRFRPRRAVVLAGLAVLVGVAGLATVAVIYDNAQACACSGG